VPGDKSISHRALLLSALAEGDSNVEGLATGDDVARTAVALRLLGARVEQIGDTRVEVEGRGGAGLIEPDDVIDVGNSGTTIRCVAGICSRVRGVSVLTGDSSVRRRPMARVVEPLRAMGARIEGRAGGTKAPLVVEGGPLVGAAHKLEVASAQVKTALLLAALGADGTTSVEEPHRSRDHTERMLGAAGVTIRTTGSTTEVVGDQPVMPMSWSVPGDISSAMYLVVAALLVPGSDLVVRDVGLNPTRIGALEVLKAMDADLEWEVERVAGGEPVGALRARHSDLRGTAVGGEVVPRLIDEIPVLAVAATQAEGETKFTDAAELRVKESDRIAAVTDALRALGATVEPLPDGLVVSGSTRLSGGRVDAVGDHRVALSLAIAASVASDEVTIEGWGAIDTSFPEFKRTFAAARGER